MKASWIKEYQSSERAVVFEVGKDEHEMSARSGFMVHSSWFRVQGSGLRDGSGVVSWYRQKKCAVVFVARNDGRDMKWVPMK